MNSRRSFCIWDLSSQNLMPHFSFAKCLTALVYVDDIIITGNHNSEVNQAISSLAGRFSIKDLGNLHFFLGIEVLCTAKGITLSQSKYMHETLSEENMQDCNSAKTPMSATEVPQLNDGMKPTDATRYRRVLGKLQYLSFLLVRTSTSL